MKTFAEPLRIFRDTLLKHPHAGLFRPVLARKGDTEMPVGKSYDGILAEADQIARVWDANPTFSMGEMTLADFRAMIQSLRDKRTTVNDTRTLLTRLVNEADDRATGLSRMSARVRGGLKATYGPNSSQYEQAQGTRESERKPRKRGGTTESSS
jgi:hypothetical protein